ncbi:uncharacterized protein VTP21DRAFT_4138 [Calcarisporiella thermophila]|uniref:uncharacterized protein n=1 Tax=Calcarisporiella thermophila TaxID=911321 RepID=UPI003741EDA1
MTLCCRLPFGLAARPEPTSPYPYHPIPYDTHPIQCGGANTAGPLSRVRATCATTTPPFISSANAATAAAPIVASDRGEPKLGSVSTQPPKNKMDILALVPAILLHSPPPSPFPSHYYTTHVLLYI